MDKEKPHKNWHVCPKCGEAGDWSPINSKMTMKHNPCGRTVVWHKWTSLPTIEVEEKEQSPEEMLAIYSGKPIKRQGKP